MSLTRLPLNQVRLGFNDIVHEAPQPIEDLIESVRDYWMNTVKLSLWNVADLNVRTNNHIEGEQCLRYAFMSDLLAQSIFHTLAKVGTIDSTSASTKLIPICGHSSHARKGEEVAFRQQSLKLKLGIQKKKAPKTRILQGRIDKLAMRFSNDDNDRTELLEDLHCWWLKRNDITVSQSFTHSFSMKISSD